MEIYDNAVIFNPVLCDWTRASFSVENGKIIEVAKPGVLSGGKVTDLDGARVIPGLIDAHIHIESTLMTPKEFGKIALGYGVTTIIADPHEIGNVAGVDGVDFMIEDAKASPADIFFMVPSCVPATPKDVGGCVISAADLKKYQNNPKVLGLGEMMNVPGVLFKDPEVAEKIASFRLIDGHAPCLSGKDLAAYVAAGIKSDHECISADEAREKLRTGMYIFLREGDAAKNVAALAEIVTPQTVSHCCFSTDDACHATGTINNCIRVALKAGMPIELALRAATLSPAEYFGLGDRGMIAPGRLADFCTLKPGDEFIIGRVFKNGVERENILEKESIAVLKSPAFNCKFPKTSDLELPDGKLRIIGHVPGEIVTNALVDQKDTEGVLKIVCIDRYRAEGFAVGLIHGFAMNKGAIATSVAHDAHNLIATGTTDDEILEAIHAVADVGGGMAVVVDGEKYVLPLALGGLMSPGPAEEVFAAQKRLAEGLAKTGALPTAFMSLSFMSLTVIPHLKITPRGLFDGDAFSDIDIVVAE